MVSIYKLSFNWYISSIKKLMSFRELRNFCEQMRALGYPRIVSIENFRRPNFELVADMLYWLAQKYDPNVEISDNIDEEVESVVL